MIFANGDVYEGYWKGGEKESSKKKGGKMIFQETIQPSALLWKSPLKIQRSSLINEQNPPNESE